MMVFGIFLAIGWISPAILQWFDHAALRYPIPDLIETAIALGFGMVFILNLSLTFSTGLWMLVKDPRIPMEPLNRNAKDLPSVTVQVAIRHEPFPLLKRTIDNLVALQYPHERLEIQIIDNSDQESSCRDVKSYCDLHGVTFIHRDGTEGFKARNLNIGLRKAKGDFLLVLDADSTVEPQTLLKVMPYFMADPKLGYIQMRAHAINKSLNLLTRILAMNIRATQRVHDLLDRHGFARFDGRNGIIRREALLEIGGWPELVSEDFVASIRMRLLGYRGRFISHVDTTEDVPENMTELIRQRRKWSNGTSEVVGMHALAILRSPYLCFSEKFNLFQVMGDYVVNALAFALAFTYVHFSLKEALLIFGVYQIPFWVANWRRPLQILLLLVPITAVMGAIMPSIFLGVFATFLGLSRGFPITLKQAGSKPISFRSLIRGHSFAIGAALFYFAVLFKGIPQPSRYLTSLQPGVVMMISALCIPILANYLLIRTTSTESPHIPAARRSWARSAA